MAFFEDPSGIVLRFVIVNTDRSSELVLFARDPVAVKRLTPRITRPVMRLE